MKRTLIKRLMALALAFTVAAFSFFMPQKVYAEENTSEILLQGKYYPTGTHLKDVIKLSNCKIDIVAGDPNYVPPIDTVTEAFNKCIGALFSYDYLYNSMSNETTINKDCANVTLTLPDYISFSDMWYGDIPFRISLESCGDVNHIDPANDCSEKNRKEFVKLYSIPEIASCSGDPYLNYASTYFFIKNRIHIDTKELVVVTFCNSVCYFEVLGWINIPLSLWSDELASGNQPINDYLNLD